MNCRNTISVKYENRTTKTDSFKFDTTSIALSKCINALQAMDSLESLSKDEQHAALIISELSEKYLHVYDLVGDE